MVRHSIGPWALCRAYLLINILLLSIQANKGLLSTYAERAENLSLDPVNEIDDPFNEARSIITSVPADTLPSDQSSPPPESEHSLSERGLQEPLYHNISGHAVENVDICKSRPFALTQENYLLSGADEWLRNYTMVHQTRRYMQKHGVISTIAHDFLGDTNFKCAVGFQHLCDVKCLTVVAHVKDLREARQVYFVLASSSHFISALTVVHEALVAAQSTTGLLAGHMAMTFFYTQPTADEEMRARAYKLLIEGTLFAAQTALEVALPMLPWSQVIHFASEKLEKIQKGQKPKLDKGKGREEVPSSTYAPFDISRYYKKGESLGLFADVNAKRVSEIFKDGYTREFFQEEGIHPEDILHYVEASRPVTGPQVWQIVQHLAEISHDRMPSEYQDDDDPEPAAEPKKGKKGKFHLSRGHSETMEEYREWERQKKNQLFDEMIGVEPLKIGVPDRYRFDRDHSRFDELRAQLQGDSSGTHTRTFGPGDRVLGKEAANLKVAKHSLPEPRRGTIWGDTVRVAWDYFKGLGASSLRKAGDALDWLDSDMPEYPPPIGPVRSKGPNADQEARIISGIRKIIKEDPDRQVRKGDPGTPDIPIRRLSYEEYLRQARPPREPQTEPQTEPQDNGEGPSTGKKEKGGKGRKGKINQEEKVGEASEPRITSLGPVDKVPYSRDRGTAFNDFKLDITTLLNPVLEGDFKSENKRKRRLSWQQRVAKTEKVLYSFFPAWQAGVVENTVGAMFSSWQADDPSKEQNQMNLHYVIQLSSGIARKGLKESAERIFGPQGVKPNGDSEIADLMAAGSLLPVSEGSMFTWTSANVEKLITKTVMFRAINAALKSQKIYISCTQDLLQFKDKRDKNSQRGVQVKECRLDNSGPQNLKACIGEVACYLYRWDDRPLIMGHHNEEPFGLKELAGPPWNINIQDIITSSFLSKIDKKVDAQLSDNAGDFINSGPNGKNALNPSAPGVFTVPVCLAPKNWNARTEGYWIGNDLNPYADVKALPCYCGDLGEDTSQIWQDTGLMQSGAQHTYTHTNCPNQFKKRLSDWLERYVAMCNMNIRKTDFGRVKSGKHALCDLVKYELQRTGVQTVTELDKEVRDALECKIKRNKKEKKCKDYYRTPIASVWDETRGPILGRVEKELKEKDTPTVAVVDGFTPKELREWEWALAETQGMKGEFKEKDRVENENHIDIPTQEGTPLRGSYHGDERDEDKDEGEDKDKGFGDEEDLNGELGTWSDDGFRYSEGHFV